MFVSVITPTYNRAHTIDRVYSSLIAQTNKDFEWIIVDDGSFDDTESLVSEYIKAADFDVVYLKKKNEGKCRSLNKAYEIARGDYTLVFDSDDWCVPSAIQEFWDEISCVSPARANEISGVSVMKCYRDGKPVGDYYPLGKIRNYVDRYNWPVKGDKWDLIRLDIVRMYTFPVFGDERYIAPSSMLLRIGQYYDTVFSNRTLSVVEYMEDGISCNSLYHRSKSPQGCCYTYQLIFDVSKGVYPKIRAKVNYFRFSFHGAIKRSISVRQYPLYLIGFFLYKKDIFLLRKK